MTNKNITQSIEEQRTYFFTHETKQVKFRLAALKKLRKAILQYEERLYDAFAKDLHKSKFEAYATEIGIVLEELGNHISNLGRWAEPKQVWSSLVHFKSKSVIYTEPFGHVLIIAPWNYPFQLLINPLIGAISAGNVVTLKPSPFTPTISQVMDNMIRETFDARYINLFQGSKEVNQELLSHKFDYIFFTGSPSFGRYVMETAAKTLTPITLELGGKSPCIVDSDANMAVAARRIAWGKFVNAGQTCIAPDYIFVHKSVKKDLLQKLKENIEAFYGKNPKESIDFGRIVNVDAFDRLTGYLKHGDIFTGGETDRNERFIAPTIIDNVKPDFPIMQQEIFGPILPVMEFEDIQEVINYLNSNPKPLAFYYFSESCKRQKDILMKTTSGGGCINDTLMHVGNSELPFGGVGNSGLGRYHGKTSFDTFSNFRSIIKKSTWIDIPIRYAPYKNKLNIVKMLLR